MSEQFTNATPLTVRDFMERGHSREAAERKVADLVFGADHRTDAEGRPIEQGKGSALQPTQQHHEALEREAHRQAMLGRHLTPETIAEAARALAVTPEAFAAAVKAVLDASKVAKPRGKPGRKPKIKQPEPADAAI